MHTLILRACRHNGQVREVVKEVPVERIVEQVVEVVKEVPVEKVIERIQVTNLFLTSNQVHTPSCLSVRPFVHPSV